MNSQEQQIQRALRTCAEEAIPDSVDLWPRIRAQAAASQQPIKKITILPQRLQPVVLVLLVILLAGAGYAAGAALQTVFFETTPGMSDVMQAGLIHEVNQSQTIDGVTVTIHSAYADARRLAVGISVRGDMGAQYSIQPEFPTINGAQMLGLHFYAEAGSIRNLVGDKSDAGSAPGFIYEAEVLEDVSPEIAQLTTIKPGGDAATINVQFDLLVREAYSNERFELIGPFRFSFDVPIQHAHRLNVQQTSRNAGVAATLEDVIITPSLMQTRICFEPEGSSDRWNAEITAARPDGLRVQSKSGALIEDGCLKSIFYGVQLDPTGTWTLTIDQLKSDTRTINGFWSFQFEVPDP